MPFAEINIVPSVNIETTSSDNPGGVTMSNFIRWRANLPEKRGGCTLFINEKLEGVPSDIQPWNDVANDPYVSVATNKQVYNYNSTPTIKKLSIISPRYVTSHAVPPNLSTTQGSSIVTIVDATNINATIYDSVTFNTPVTVGGVILQGTYQIIQGSGNTTYQIDAFDIASSTETGGTLPVFTVVGGSSTVEVAFPTQYQGATPHSLAVGDRIGYVVPTTVGGSTIFGQYLISDILGPDKFSIVDDTAATSAATVTMNNGLLDLTYWIVDGPTVTGPGYGANEYGQYEYGRGQGKPPLQGGTYEADQWYLDNRGSTLIACAAVTSTTNSEWKPSPIFYWNDSFGFQHLAILNNAPIANNGAFVSMPYGHIMAWGCSEQINPFPDPLHIRWSSATDPDNWSLAGNSDAGFYNIPTGSKVVRGIQGATQQYWFTDVDVYVAQYVGYPGTYGFNKVGAGCGLIAPRAVAVLGSSMYWMSQNQFFVCPAGGAPQAIPCSVWDFIFQNLSPGFEDSVVCGANSYFNEVSWFFPTKVDPESGDPQIHSTKPTAYVCYNAQYNEWDVGYINRTAWYDQSQQGGPLAADTDGWVYQHETSYNLSVGQTVVPINAWFQTGYYSLDAGNNYSFVDWVIPDMKWSQYSDPDLADLTVTLYVTDYPGQEPRVHGPYPFSKLTKFINPRLRGRYVSFKFESTDLNSFWRLGSIRYRYAPAGRR